MMLMKDYEIKYLKKKLLEEQQKVESMLDESKKTILAWTIPSGTA